MINLAHVKTIVVDLDKTLLHTDKTLSAYTVAVLKECHASVEGFRTVSVSANYS